MTARELLRGAKAALAESGVPPEDAAFESRLMLERAGVSRMTQLTEPNAPLPEAAERAFGEMLRRRTAGEPLQYILGSWEFCGLEFDVGEGVLIPRSDTEILVQVCADFLSGGKGAAADLCAGSGCVGIALARLYGCSVTSVELSAQAFCYLERNIAKNGAGALVKPVCADVLSESTAQSVGAFDIIAANPPYLTERDMLALQREVRFEPEMALFGGRDGLDFYRALLPLWTPRLKAGGLFAVEIGMGQESDVAQIFRQNGIEPQLAKDNSGIYRVVFGKKMSPKQP